MSSLPPEKEDESTTQLAPPPEGALEASSTIPDHDDEAHDPEQHSLARGQACQHERILPCGLGSRTASRLTSLEPPAAALERL